MSDLVTKQLVELPTLTALSPDALALVQEPDGPMSAIPIALLLGKLISTDVATATRADLYAALAYDANAIGLVFADPTPAQCGWYRKIGASGTGSWSQFEKLSSQALAEIQAAIDACLAATSSPALLAVAGDLPNINAVATNLAAVDAVASAAVTLGLYPNAAGVGGNIPKGAISFSFTAGSGGTNSVNNVATFTGGTLTYNPQILYDVVAGAVTNVRMLFGGLYIGSSTPTMPTVVLANGGTGTITLAQGRYYAAGQGYWAIAADGRTLDRIVNVANAPTADVTVPSLPTLTALYDQYQTIGYPGSIPDGANTANGTYGILDPVLGDGITRQLRGYFPSAGTVTVQRFGAINGTWTSFAALMSVTIPAAGYQVVPFAMSVREGDILVVGGSIIRYAAEVVDGDGLTVITNGLAVATTPSLVNARLHIAIDINFRSKRSDTRRQLIDVHSSDKLVGHRNSYMENVYGLRGKGELQALADLTEWRVEDESQAGFTVAQLLGQLQSNTVVHPGMPMRALNPTWVIAGQETNDSLNATYLNNYRQLIESSRALGAGVILLNEHSVSFADSVATSLDSAVVRKLADDHGAVYCSLREAASRLMPGVGGYGADYTGWVSSGTPHPGTRVKEVRAAVYRELVETTLGRPRKWMRAFRPRPNQDGSAPTIASKDALLYDPSNLYQRHKLFMEISHGQRALTVANEKYVDEVSNGAVVIAASDQVSSEYVLWQMGRTVAFTDYAGIEAGLPVNGNDVTGIGIKVSDPTIAVYIRDAFYTDLVDTTYPAATAPTGRWKSLLVDSDGFARLTGRAVRGSIWGDKVVFLFVKAGAFSISEPVIEYYGRDAGKVAPLLKSAKRPVGTTLITNPFPVASGAPAAGWTATGAPAYGVGLPAGNAMLPRGATGHVDLTTANKLSATLSWAVDLYHDREIEIEIIAMLNRPLVVSGTSNTATDSITRWTCDIERLLIELVGSANTVPIYKPVGLYWTPIKFRTWAPARSTGTTIRLSAETNTISLAYAQATFVDA